MTSYYFVIDTDSYAGNFERPMCAYMTGQIGDCEVGEKESKLFEEEEGDLCKFDDLVTSESDEHGCSRPVKIYATPGWFNICGEHFRKDDPKEKKRAKAHWEKTVAEVAEADESYRAILDGVGYHENPAYQSVAICLNQEPNPEEVSFLKKRARAFAKAHKTYDGLPSIKITGFRFVTERTVEESKAL